MTDTIRISPLDLVASRKRARAAAAETIRLRLRLPPKLTLSQWADRCRVLSSESSAEPGPWRTDRAPYLREIMDTISGSEYNDFTIVKCSQSGGTEVINNAVGYFIDQEPSPILVIQPNVKPMAETWSKDRLAPMLRDSPRLRDKVRDPRARDSGNTVLHKVFPGGHITVIGANSPAGLASRPIRVVCCDELDRWGASAGTEGDPLKLAIKRAVTYRHRRKIIKVTSLGNEGESRGEKEWALSDQRYRYVPCPFCGHEQPLEWRDSNGHPDIRPARGAYRLLWEKTLEGDAHVHHPETARYQCRSCEALIEESWKAWMDARGKWVKHNPESRRAGWHIPGLLSPWVRWSEIAEEWLQVKDDPEQRKPFFNTTLGLLNVELGEKLSAEKLEDRREEYAAEVPAGVGILTAGVDVQNDRLEVEVRGWGDGEESWQVRLDRILGDPEEAAVWERLEELLVRQWRHESGMTIRIVSCMVDSGDKSAAVYAFVRPRQLRGVYAAKGNDNAKQPLSKMSKANRDGVKVYTHRPSVWKDILFSRLRRQMPGSGYLHFGRPEQTGADSEYFRQFEAEKRVSHWTPHGPQVRYVNPKRARNEAIDLYVLNLVALRAMGLTVTQSLAAYARKLAEDGEKLRADAARSAQEQGIKVPLPPPPPRGFVSGWKRRPY